MKERVASIIGASGFIGSNLTREVLKKGDFAEVRAATRTLTNQALLDKIIEYKDLFPDKRISIIETDRLDFRSLKLTLDEVDVIFDTAGIAWQHPAIELTKQDLLTEQVLNNTLSAYFLGLVLDKKQTLVWTSTNAADTLQSHIPASARKLFQMQADKLLNILIGNINPANPLDQNRLDTHYILEKHLGCYGSLAYDMSYAFSKYLGQKVLERVSQGNIRVLKISDVYGPGQDISSKVLDPKVPARRIQRFVASYRAISEGDTDWIPQDGKQLHGFYRKGDKIFQDVWSDFVFPTYVSDVCEMMIRASRLENTGRTLFEVTGPKLNNYDMATAIRDFYDAPVKVRSIGTHIDVLEKSQHLGFLDMARRMTPFDQGLKTWLS